MLIEMAVVFGHSKAGMEYFYPIFYFMQTQLTPTKNAEDPSCPVTQAQLT